MMVKTKSGQIEVSVFETNVPPRFRIYYFGADGTPKSFAASQKFSLQTIRPDGTRQTFEFKPRKGYLEATETLPEPHEFAAILRLAGSRGREEKEIAFVEEHHHHQHHTDHPSADHASRITHHASHGRNFSQIKQLIAESNLSPWVKEKSIAVFERIAIAEGKIHGLPPAEVHFHEVGAVDSIVDIVGACIGLEILGKPRVLAAPVVEGTGWINCQHGRFPIPAPATLNILAARGVAVSQCDEPHELVTPTGAALLAEFVETFGPMRNLAAEKIGFGLGTRDNLTRPNVLRAILGEERPQEEAAQNDPHDWERDTIAVLEANLDDLNPEILGCFVNRALAEGALDVFHTPIQMKKNRPGVLLTVLCAEHDADKFSELMLRETSTFGLRRSLAQRRKLHRRFATVQTPYGEATVKLGELDGQVLQAAPEFESCRKLALDAKVPLKRVYEAVARAMDDDQG
jgi:uncharacterized protein (TIGR00299 family) protein